MHVGRSDARDAVVGELVEAAGHAAWSAGFVTLRAENTFPALPIREDADVVVILTAGAEIDAGDEQLRLEPTTRSRLR